VTYYARRRRDLGRFIASIVLFALIEAAAVTLALTLG
jgi:hypothetical protein